MQKDMYSKYIFNKYLLFVFFPNFPRGNLLFEKRPGKKSEYF